MIFHRRSIFHFYLLLFNADDFLLRGGDEGLLLVRDGHVRDGDRDGADGGILVAERLDVIEHLGRNGEAVLLDAAVNDLALRRNGYLLRTDLCLCYRTDQIGAYGKHRLVATDHCCFEQSHSCEEQSEKK